jgi:hypothetical protein
MKTRNIVVAGLCAALCAALLGGCGGGGMAATGTDGGSTACTSGQALDLNKTYGILALLNVHVTAASIVSTDTQAKLLLLDQSTQTGTNLGVSATLCDLTVPPIMTSGSNKPITFAPSQDLIMSVPMQTGSATLSGTTSCSTFTITNPLTITLGAKAAAGSPLPAADPSTGAVTMCGTPSTMTSCPTCGPCNFADTVNCANATGTDCACDAENSPPDGLVGATMNATNVPGNICQAFAAVRTSFALTGTVYSSDKIIGTVTGPATTPPNSVTMEQSILGCNVTGLTGNCDQPCDLATLQSAVNLNPVIAQNPTVPSTFEAVSVPSGTTCAQLKAMESTLFTGK